ncbi:MAG TPA: PaaI family thioesterase [Acidimicrobiales bacterium]|nr:PaaI family thioesterase [Acidimicrobiales bacterium]
MSNLFEDDAPPGDLRRRLAAAIRPIITMNVAAELDDAALTEAAEAMEAIAERLAARAGPKRTRNQPDLARAAQDFFPTSPVIGLANPVAPPVRVAVVEGEDGRPEIRGLANFGFAYEGPPTCVHGGVIAELLDEVLGAANIVAQHAAMTGTLTIRYRSPTPLNTDLRVEARFVRQDGRKIYAWGGVYHGDVLTAEADGLFIEVRPKQMLTIAEANVDSVDPGMLDAIRAEALREGAASDVQPMGGAPVSVDPGEPE